MVAAAEMLGDRWSLLILRELFYGVSRFADLLTDLSAPRSTLSDRLTALVSAGLVDQFAYREAGSRERAGYRLTELGRTLTLPLLALAQWYDDELRTDAPPVRVIDKRSKATARLVFIDPDGREVPAADIGLEILDSGSK
jgi:DNA-binding HxlR family transcriptional regulator